MIGIYMIRNKINNKKYIGQAVNIMGRWRNGHLLPLRNGKHGNDHLQKAWNKYGENNFEFSLIIKFKNLNNNLLDIQEKFWIKYYCSNDSNFGYNKTDGGQRGSRHNEETKKRISIAHKGKKLTLCHRQKLSRKKTEEEKQKMKKTIREKNKNKKSEDFFWYGRNHTEESKQKNRESHLGKKLSEEHKQKIKETSTGRMHREESKDKVRFAKYKLSNEQVFEVLEMVRNLEDPKIIAGKFNVSDKTILRIANNTTYMHIEREKLFDKYKGGRWI